MKSDRVAAGARVSWAVCISLLLLACSYTSAQTLPDTSSPQPTQTPSLEKNFLRNILRDQRGIWTSPFHLEKDDAKWMLPLGLSAATLFATDRHTSGELVESNNGDRLRISKDISQLGSVYATAGTATTLYLIGRARHDDRLRETGLLGGEALINGFIVTGVLKTISQRQRPTVDHASGEFFGGGSSFPSGHATAAWSLSTVIAREYGQHRPLVRFGMYGVATAVSLSRYSGQKHFLSDVLIGSALGFGIGNYVYSQHHDKSLDTLPEKRTTTSLLHSKMFPELVPLYEPREHTYGAMLNWSF